MDLHILSVKEETTRDIQRYSSEDNLISARVRWLIMICLFQNRSLIDFRISLARKETASRLFNNEITVSWHDCSKGMARVSAPDHSA